MRHRGSCLCGSVRYELTGELGEFGYCHCRSCKKASGSAFGANAPIERASFELTQGEERLREYESSPGKVRVFCGGCGSPIYAYWKTSPNVLRIRLGSLDTPFRAEPKAHSFVGEKPPWDSIDAGLPQFREWPPKDVIEQRGSKQPSDDSPR